MIQLTGLLVDEGESARVLLGALLGNEGYGARRPNVSRLLVATFIIVDLAVMVFAVMHRVLLVLREQTELAKPATWIFDNAEKPFFPRPVRKQPLHEPSVLLRSSKGFLLTRRPRTAHGLAWNRSPRHVRLQGEEPFLYFFRMHVTIDLRPSLSLVVARSGLAVHINHLVLLFASRF